MTSSAQNSKQILSQKGSAATPGVSFQGDNDTGIFSSASNSMGIAAGGTKIVDVTPTGVSITGSLTPSTALAVANGGTGATDASGARANLSAAKSGANSDITSITGLTTALTVTQGGTGAATLTGYVKGSGTAALTASATISGADISGNISGNAANVTGTVAVANGGTGGTTASAARANLSAASSGANSDISSLTGLTTALTAAQGGTGFGTYAVGDILYASTTNALSTLSDVATGNALISGGTSTAPSWGKIGLTTHVSGTLGVANGGTGAATLTGYVKGSGTSALTASATIPTSDLSGTLAVANGGTGQTTYTDGQLLIGNSTGNTLAKATLSPGTGISITNGSGTISIAATGTVFSYPSAGVVVSTGSAWGSSLTAPAGALVGTTDAQTLTNKAITPRVPAAIADGTSVTLNCDTTDLAYQTNTQAAGTLTMNAPTGTPTNGQKLVFRLQATNAQTFSWNSIFSGSVDQSLPTVSSSGSKYDYMGFVYNTQNTKWNMVAKNFGF
ncbi:hypothetical protein UFOVP122_49 [uncultured Caudovirales phage]|uniref:Uncharacterized protein n=1 Tax=uncultured Caudovirales phage TaxID=2100421 RepID=A0A6J5LC43_9CAUD|nr:hypothetical protein UFOVP122_49 [uncultured Caudovirales phage]